MHEMVATGSSKLLHVTDSLRKRAVLWHGVEDSVASSSPAEIMFPLPGPGIGREGKGFGELPGL